MADGENAPKSSANSRRRRYFSSGRSRTIELSTLAEIDEEEVARIEHATSDERTTQDDMCIGTSGGTYKSIKRGAVKAQALKLSERLAEKIAAEKTAKELEMEQQGCSKRLFSDVNIRRNLTEIRKEPRFAQTSTDFTPVLTPAEWSSHEIPAKCSIQHAPRRPISRSASFVTPTPFLVYNMPTPDADLHPPLPIYYMPSPPTQAPPIFVPFHPGHQKMAAIDGAIPMMINFDMPQHVRRKIHHHHNADTIRRKNEGWCERICCAGLAQLLWTIVCIISFGVIASLILALCYI